MTSTKAVVLQATSTRDLLLDATSALMIERNSVTVSLNDIAQKSGLNSALISYYFGGKAGLFKALLERDAGSAFGPLERLVQSDLDAVEKLRRHVSGIIRTYFRYPYMNRLIGALAVDPDSDTARFISERFTKPLAQAQQAILEQGRVEGAFRDIDPMLFYFSLIGACDHLFHARHSLKYAFGIDEIDDRLRQRYTDHLCTILIDSVLLDRPTEAPDSTGNMLP